MHNQYHSSIYMYSYNKGVLLNNIYSCMFRHFYVTTREFLHLSLANLHEFLKLKLLQLQFHSIIKILLIVG